MPSNHTKKENQSTSLQGNFKKNVKTEFEPTLYVNMLSIARAFLMYLEGTLYAFKEERDLMPTYRCE
jgi:hypothetical protein